MKRFQRDPFSLMTFHRVLIGSATAACIFFGVWQFLRYREGHGGSVATGLFSCLLALGLIVYLWRIRGKQL